MLFKKYFVIPQTPPLFEITIAITIIYWWKFNVKSWLTDKYVTNCVCLFSTSLLAYSSRCIHFRYCACDCWCCEKKWSVSCECREPVRWRSWSLSELRFCASLCWLTMVSVTFYTHLARSTYKWLAHLCYIVTRRCRLQAAPDYKHQEFLRCLVQKLR